MTNIKKPIKKVCLVGPYSPSNKRNKIFIDALKHKNIDIDKIKSRDLKTRIALSQNKHYHLKFWFSLVPRILIENFLSFIKILFNINKIYKCDTIIIPGYGNYIFPTVKFWSLIFKKPMILEAHGSLYYQRIIGTQDYPEDSFYAKIVFTIDKLGAILSDRYITLSKSYADLLSKNFNVDRKKFISLYAGSDILSYIDNNIDINRKIDIVMFGGFKIFHGFEKIIEAARLLKEKYNEVPLIYLMGDGPEKNKCLNLINKYNLTNIKITGFISQHELLSNVLSAKISFGPLGNSKLNNVDLSTKICESAALNKATILLETPSTKELFTNQESAMLCKSNSPQEIGEKILYLLKNKEIRKKLASNMFDVYNKKLSVETLGDSFIKQIYT